MPLILLIVALVALRYFEVWKFAELSWWAIGALMVVAFLFSMRLPKTPSYLHTDH